MPGELTRCMEAFERLETERLAVLERLGEWPEECLGFRPAPGAWSAPEVLDHIVRCESGTVADMRVTLARPQPIGDAPRPNVAVLDASLRSDHAFKVPAGAPEIFPDAACTLVDVAHRWEQARTEMQLLLEKVTEADARCGAFEHPFAGWMTFREVLEHFSSHLFHHGFQLERLRAGWARLQTQIDHSRE